MTEQPHETTWEDIARGYRQILESVLPVFSSHFSPAAIKPLTDAVEAVDTEADLLAKNEREGK